MNKYLTWNEYFWDFTKEKWAWRSRVRDKTEYSKDTANWNEFERDGRVSQRNFVSVWGMENEMRGHWERCAKNQEWFWVDEKRVRQHWEWKVKA